MPAVTQPFVARYLAGEIAPFFQLRAGDTKGALARRFDRPRTGLAGALQQEAARLSAPREVLASIARLGQPESRAVVTGQQPGLLLGPAYTLSKAMSAISLARELDSDERPVVPVFWLAGQDHDTAEVDHAHLLDREERLHRLDLPLPPGVATGRTPFRHEWLGIIEDGLERVGGRQEHIGEVSRLLDDVCASAQTFADMFAGLLYRLLGDQGLIVLDPTRPDLAPFFREVLERELAEPQATVRAIVEAGEELRALGLEPQLGRGQGATNLFLEEDEGGLPCRHLLRFDGRTFQTPAGDHTLGELRTVLCEEPWRLTPAAGLRPVTQDAVLPTAAFVVGPGELRYLAQLKGVYEHHSVAMPLMWPRATSVVLEPPAVRILERYGLDYGRYSAERGLAMERVLLELHGHSHAFEQALLSLGADSEELRRHVAAIDPTLEGTVERGRLRVERTIELLRGKSAAALAKRDEITRRQFERLEAQLFPGGVQQERFLSPFSFFLKFGCGPMMSLYQTVGPSGEYLLTP